MLSRLIILVAFFIAVLCIIKLIRGTPKSQLKQLYWKLGLGTAAIVLIVLAITGRVHWLSAVVGAALPFIRNAIPLLLRYMPLIQQVRNMRSKPTPSSGNCSHVNTSILNMTLDHDSNQLSGTIIDGPYRGQALDSLSSSQLQRVLDHCHTHDQESVKLMVSYLNHRFGPRWRQQGPLPGEEDNNEKNYEGPMTAKAAYSMLGIAPGATKKEIIRAHRKMMQKVHPDHGGSDFLAAQINEARDFLMKRFS